MSVYVFGDSTDIILGGGYNNPGADFTNPWIIIPGQEPIYIPIGVVPSGTNTTPGTVTVITTYPEQEPTVTSPVAAPPAYEIARLLNQAWNTSARSIAALVRSSYLLFNAADISGACLMLGPKEKDGQGIQAFSHGMAIDSAGVHIYEGGEFKTTMRSPHSPVTALRIYRHEDGTIVYVTTTGTETIVYNSLAPYPFPSFIDVFVYGYLYSSGDQITAASFETGEVQYGSV